MSAFAQGQDNLLPPTGNVGIGTMTPSAKLDVNGRMIVDSTLLVKDSVRIEKDLRIEQDLKVDGKVVMLQNSVAREDFKIQGDLKLPNVQSVVPTIDEQILFSNPNGKVVAGTANDFGNLIYGKLCTTDINGDILNPVWNNGLNKLFTHCDQVNVGIGTSEPRTKLDVIGNISAESMCINLDPADRLCELHIKGITPPVANHPIMIIENLTGQTARRVFQVNGDGLTLTREVKVNALQWADFVFKENYQLKSLNEVEAFIGEHGHLPDVPSEADVQENGIKLGEMDAKLLQKIEELTLYTIEQQKQIDKLRKELNELKSK